MPPILQLETASGLSGAIGRVNVVKGVEVEPSTEPNMPSTNLENLVEFHTRKRSFVTPSRAEVGKKSKHLRHGTRNIISHCFCRHLD